MLNSTLEEAALADGFLAGLQVKKNWHVINAFGLVLPGKGLTPRMYLNNRGKVEK